MSKKNTAKLPVRGGERRRQSLARVAIVVVLLALIAAIGTSVYLQKKHKDDQAAQLKAAAGGPAPFVNGALRFGDPSGKVVLNLKEDFQCPACRVFEAGNNAYITGLINSGKVSVDYDPIAILDKASTTNYSSRATNASTCVAVADKSKWLAFHKLLFDNQPEEATAGLPDSQLIALAKQAGAPDVSSCVTSNKYADFVKANKDNAIDHGLTHTPTVSVNGVELTANTSESLQAAIAKALADSK